MIERDFSTVLAIAQHHDEKVFDSQGNELPELVVLLHTSDHYSIHRLQRHKTEAGQQGACINSSASCSEHLHRHTHSVNISKAKAEFPHGGEYLGRRGLKQGPILVLILPMLRLLLYKTQGILEKQLNPVMLVFIG